MILVPIGFFAAKTEELRIRDVSLVVRKSAKRDATFNSHGHSTEGAKRKTVVRMSIGYPFHHMRMDAGAYVLDVPMFFRSIYLRI